MYLVAHASYVSRPEFAIVRQSTGIPDTDVMEVEDLLLTTPGRTTSDLLRRHYRPHALAAGDAMYRAGLIAPATWPSISRACSTFGAPQAKGWCTV